MRLHHAPKALAGLVLLLCGTSVAQATTQAQRMKLAQHAIGINSAFYEGQRAGVQPPDSVELFPNVWEWKQPGYENICTGFLETLTAAEREDVDFTTFPGYFEAGNAVLVTAPTAFVTVQQAIGALQFMPQLAGMMPGDAFGDPAGCLNGSFTTRTLEDLVFRQLRYLGATLSNSIVKTTADGSEFVMLVGVSDSSTYGAIPFTSWESPPDYSEKCYVADIDHPAADIAAQAAAGLAMVAEVFMRHGTAADKQMARRYGTEATRTYAYAKLMYERHGNESTCFRSAANNNCIGTGCTTIRDNGEPVQSSCSLYRNTKDPQMSLFVGAAAMYFLTGREDYRADADAMFPDERAMFYIYLYNWNNVVAQGLVLMSMAPDSPGALRSQEYYRGWLRTSVGFWSSCSNDGEAKVYDYRFCERTPGGSAYPLDFPWGNLGTTMNGMCAAGIYQALGYDGVDSKARKDAACFMQRQLGYIFNHKCTTPDNSCNTQGPDGFSYMVGIGRYYPTRIHSRDISVPNFYNNDFPDNAPMCGALVSGPYENPSAMDGPVREGTDLYEDNRLRWQASEAAIDYTSSLVCTLMAYATMPDSLFEDCPARTPFTGRGV
eukprot:jgi/Ulvmu1/10069/UM006_0016.1